jgi:transposase
MPKPLAVELRERAVIAYEAGNWSYQIIAAQFSVSRRALQRWVALQRVAGTPDPAPPSGGRYSPVDMKKLRALVEESPDATTFELTSRYNSGAAKAHRVHRSSIIRAIRRAGYVFKKSGRGRQNKIVQT